jgi:hypothetical protein
MSTINTSNVNTLAYQMPSLEVLGKYDIAQQKKTVENFVKAQKDRIESLKSLTKQVADGSISKDEYEKRKKQIDENLNKVYHRSPTPEIQKGNNGEVVAKHKNKLGFIFIGDTLNAEKNDLFSVNAPKMTLAVGGALETTFNPFKNDVEFVDPRDEFIPQASAQIHLISSSDINVEGIFSSSAFRNKSAVKIRSDVLDFSANQAVLIRSLNTPYVAGVRSYSPGGVHIVSGQGDSKNFKELEPMVLGQSLNSTLNDIMKLIGDMVSVIKDINSGIISLKTALSLHTHIVPLPTPIPTVPSAELIAHATATAVTEDLLNTGNLYSILFNTELLKLNDLMAMSPNSFTSKFNRVN